MKSLPIVPNTIQLERDHFLRTLLRHLTGALQDVVGTEEASGFISVVGQRIGEELGEQYTAAFNVRQLSRDQVIAACLDLKERINGDFYLISADEEKIVFGNRACPFEDKVFGRESLCMMTSNVFGTIAADNLGYGRIDLEQTIARGDAACRVVLYLQPAARGGPAKGREYFGKE